MTTKSALATELLNQSFPDIKLKIIQKLKDKALFEGDSILPSGKIATKYLDIKQLTLSAEGGALAAQAILSKLRDDVECIGGTRSSTFGLTTNVSQLAYLTGKNVDSFIVREQARNLGSSRWIEGYIAQGATVALIHELATDGLDLIKSIRTLQEEYKAQVVQIISLVDIEDGACERLESIGLDYTPIVLMSEVDKPERNPRNARC